MAFESNTYSGICKYKDIDFTFIFSGEELRLVPPADKREIIQMDWVLTPLAKGVYTRGDPLTMDEPYLTEKSYGTADIEYPYTVPQNSFFVLGDHRESSVDSRSSLVGCVEKEEIIGKIIFRVWPIKRIGSADWKYGEKFA